MSSDTRVPFVSSLGFDPDYLHVFEELHFFEGPQSRRRLTNFFTLLLFATIIATYGVLSDSSATVIGAMLIAPLMTPIIATAAAVVMGAPHRAWRAIALTAAGVITVILIAFLLTTIVPDKTISFTENDEISSRTDPGLYALVTALAAGAAGAFITSRSEIADAIGGVAIAVALVPPLCVVGISLQQGQWDAASGALLLFMTNYMATLLAGGLVLMVIGLGKLGFKEKQVRTRQVGFGIIIVITSLLTISLTFSALTGFQDLKEDSIATREVEEWLEGTSYEIISVDVDDDLVEAGVQGTGELPSLKDLEEQIAAALQHPVIVKLNVIPTLISNTTEP